MKKLSVIVPYMTGREYLSDCLESLGEQTYKDFEVILIQDRINNYLSEKKDNVTVIEDPSELISYYNEKFNISVIQLQKPSGVKKAREAGIREAKGEYIYFLDSDDYLHSNTLENLVTAMDEGYDYVYGEHKDTVYKKKVYFSLEHKSDVEDEEEDNSQDNEEENVGQSENQVVNFEPVEYLFNKRIFGKITMLNIVIRRNILDKKSFENYGHNTFHYDQEFIGELLSLTGKGCFVEEAYYVKRRHTDPIHYPSLSEYSDVKKFYERVEIHNYCTKIFNEGMSSHNAEKVNRCSELTLIIQRQIIDYYTNIYVKRVKRSKDKIWKGECFVMMQNILKQIDKKDISKFGFYQKKLIDLGIKGNIKSINFLVSCNLGIEKYKKIKKSKLVLMKYLYSKLFLKLPIQKKCILFESFLGGSYSDSPKYIFEYLYKENGSKYKYVWIINNNKTDIPYPCIKVKRFSVKHMYYMARAKYFVFNGRQPAFNVKRPKTVFLETWHGTPLKKLVFDQEEVCSATSSYRKVFYKQSRQWDYLVSDNNFSTKIFEKAFLFNKPIIESGYPRNDILYAVDKDERIKKLKESLQIPQYKKVLLYAPTWRDDEYYGSAQYKFTLQLDLERMKNAFGEQYVILLRTHYFIADKLNLGDFPGFAYDCSKYNDIAELYLISDILITDYSSVFFDYANLKRPILFYTYDLEKYRDVLRGFYLDVEKEVPGPLLFTTDEVIDAIEHIGDVQNEYAAKYKKFYDRFCYLNDGNASKRVVDMVFHKKK